MSVVVETRLVHSHTFKSSHFHIITTVESATSQMFLQQPNQQRGKGRESPVRWLQCPLRPTCAQLDCAVVLKNTRRDDRLGRRSNNCEIADSTVIRSGKGCSWMTANAKSLIYVYNTTEFLKPCHKMGQRHQCARRIMYSNNYLHWNKWTMSDYLIFVI